MHETPTLERYLAETFGPDAVVGVDPSLFSHTAWNSLQANLHSANQRLEPVKTNLVDLTWDNDDEGRPTCPNQPIVSIPVNFTGKSTADKLIDLRKLMSDKGASGVVLVQLDDIACK